MEWNRQTVKSLLLVICGGAAFYCAIQHLDAVTGAVAWLLGILAPFLLGGAIAFILNVPMRAIERHLMPKNRRADRFRRPLALVLTLVAVIGVLTLASSVIGPGIADAVMSISRQIPVAFRRLNQKLTDLEAYLPLLTQIRQTGVTCILVHMPFRMAIFDVNAAEDVMAQFPEIRHWYLAGHSMGGAMASKFASDHPDQVEGLILMGAYLYGDYPEEQTLTIYGSLNQSVEDHIDYTENIVEIQGGNHAQFGNYGPQKGDLPAEISAQEQQAQTVAAIEAFLSEQ